MSDAYDGDRVFVGEVWVATPERLARYLRPGELHTAFNFDFLLAQWDAAGAARGDRREHRRARRRRRAGDVGAFQPRRRAPRHALRRRRPRPAPGPGRGPADVRPARRGVRLPGRGARTGRGPRPARRAARRTRRSTARRAQQKGRDGCRVPLPWSGDEPPFGFGPGPSTWLPQPAEWAELTAERAGRPTRLDAVALPPGARPAPSAAGARRRHAGVDRGRRRCPRLPPRSRGSRASSTSATPTSPCPTRSSTVLEVLS